MGLVEGALPAQVNSVQAHPVDCNLLLSGSNDWTARLADLRCLTSAHSEPDSGKGRGPGAGVRVKDLGSGS